MFSPQLSENNQNAGTDKKTVSNVLLPTECGEFNRQDEGISVTI